MKRKPAWCLAMIGAAMAISAGTAAGGVGDLEYVEAPLSMGGGMVCRSRKPVGAGARESMGLQSPKAVLLHGTGPVRVALDAESAAAALNVVRVDVTGTGSFKKTVTIESKMSGTTGRFGPQAVQVRLNGKIIPVIVSGHYHGGGNSVSGGAGLTVAAEGTCAFGNTLRKVRIVDGNGNLSLGDDAKPPFTGVSSIPKADRLILANKQGRLAGRGGLPMLLGQPVQVDGAWYVVSVNGLKVSAAAAGGERGKITVDAASWTCTLAGEKYFLAVTGGKDPVDVPADSYRVLNYQMSMQGEPGVPGATITGSNSKNAFDTKAGRTTRLGIGSPIKARITTRKVGSSRTVYFSLDQTDAAGAKIGSVLGAGGKRPPKPTINVVDSGGRVVYTARMEYG